MSIVISARAVARATAVVLAVVLAPSFANADATQTSVTTSPNPSVYGNPVTFTATVTSGTAGMISGPVVFKSDGTVLGQGGATLRNKVTGFAGSENHHCQVFSDGFAQCWGWNGSGQLGTGTRSETAVTSPVAATAFGGDIKEISTQNDFTCAVYNNGIVKCVGYDGSGIFAGPPDLENDENNYHTTPVQIANLTDVKSISFSATHACAVLNDGTAQCWGLNTSGQLGDGTTTPARAYIPQTVQGLTGITEIKVNADYTCAIASGEVWCWGLAYYSPAANVQTWFLGQNTTGTVNSPAVTMGASTGHTGLTFSGLTNGLSHMCALTNDARAYCWGNNRDGQVGKHLSSLPPPSFPEPQAVASEHYIDENNGNTDAWIDLTNIVSISAGNSHTCAVRTSGTVYCWGYNNSGQLGRGTFDNNGTVDLNDITPAPVQAEVGVNLTQATPLLLAVANHACVLVDAPERVKCWGQNSFGHLGDGTTTDSAYPVDVDADGPVYKAEITVTTMEYLAAGTRVITAEYQGDGGTFDPSTSADHNHVQNVAPTTISVTAQASPTTYKQTATFVATISSTTGPIPSGSVAIHANGSQIGTSLLIAGTTDATATFDYEHLNAGDNTITAHFVAQGNFGASDSSGYSHTVDKADVTVTLNTSPNPSNHGQPITFTATVTSPAGTPPDGITVDFKIGGAAGGTFMTRTMTGGVATGTASQPAGNYVFAARFAGDSNYATRFSSDIPHTVGKAATTTALTVTPANAKPGQAVQLKATLTGGTANGQTITFKNGNTVIDTAALAAGSATVTTRDLPIGQYNVTASFAGTAALNASSGAKPVNINPKVGAEFRANHTVANAQQFPSAGRLLSGVTVVAWASMKQDGNGYGIYQARYTAAGARIGNTDTLVSTTKAGDQTVPAVSGMTNQGYVIVWQGGAEIFGQRYDKNGGKLGVEFPVNTTKVAAQTAPVVTGLTGGGFAVAWESAGQDKSGTGIYAQIFNANGGKVGKEFLVNTTTAGAQAQPAISGILNGGFAVTWVSDGLGAGKTIAMQLFKATGAKTGAQRVVNATAAGNQITPTIAGLANGQIVVAWQSSGQDGSMNGIYARRFTAAGAPQGGEFRVNTTTTNDQTQPTISGFADKGFVIAWTSAAQDTSGKGVYVQAYNTNGTPFNIEFRANTMVTKDQWQPSVITYTAGKFVIVWTSRDQDGSLEGVYGQRFEVVLP